MKRKQLQQGEHDAEVRRLEKRHDWNGVVSHCSAVDLLIRKAMRAGNATAEDRRLRVSALLDLHLACVVLDLPERALKAVKDAHKAILAEESPDQFLHNHLSYSRLARAYVANGQLDEAREMHIHSAASLITRQQAEFFRIALLDLGRTELEAGRPETAETLNELSVRLKRASRWAHRGGMTITFPQELADRIWANSRLHEMMPDEYAIQMLDAAVPK